MDEKYVKVDDIVEYCNTYSVCLQNKGQGVAQAALRRVTEFAKENSADVQPVVHAKWEISSDGYYPYCSRCFGRPNGELTKYCPDCGARMDLDSVTHDRCSNYMDCDGHCFIDDTPCDCDGNIEKCKGR